MVSRLLRRPLSHIIVLVLVVAPKARPLGQHPRGQTPSAILVDTKRSKELRGSAQPLDFFREDSRKIAEMPPYAPDAQAKPQVDTGICEPRCLYSCGTKECDQVCEPLCAPPQCETVCMKSADKCETRCGPPKCAVVCPSSKCLGGNCPKCRTVCSPPACTTECTDDCHSVCSKPSCTWKCHAGQCPKPSCKMSCVGTRRCRSGLPPLKSEKKVPRAAGSTVVSEGVASLDPTVLATPPIPPPVVTAPPPSADLEAARQKLSPVVQGPGPVQMLKRHWQVEDDNIEQMRLLRR